MRDNRPGLFEQMETNAHRRIKDKQERANIPVQNRENLTPEEMALLTPEQKKVRRDAWLKENLGVDYPPGEWKKQNDEAIHVVQSSAISNALDGSKSKKRTKESK